MADKGYTETRSGKLWEKTKNAPFVPIGILGTLGMIGYGIAQFKNKGTMSTSVYLMQYRVRAQSVIVGALTLGVSYSLLKDYVFNKDHHKNGHEHDK